MPQFTTLKNDTLLRALARQPTDYTPVWLMRQAGRYLPEYREIRARAGSFLNLAKNVDYATEVSLQPLERYPLDAAILFSDILTVPDAMGLGLYVAENEGPGFERPLQDEKAILALQVPQLEQLNYVFDTVTQIRRVLDGRVPLIGFAGSPWTLACYMVEGKRSDEFPIVKSMLHDRPELMHHILDINAQAVALYLNAQIDAGSQVLMIFDTWGGILADGVYQTFSLHYLAAVVRQLKREVAGVPIPVILYTKSGDRWLEQIAQIGVDAISLDWTVDLGQARKRIGHQVALQGNLDPEILLLTQPAQIREKVRQLLLSFGQPEAGVGHVFNLGHGISQFTPHQSVGVLVDAVHEISQEIRRPMY